MADKFYGGSVFAGKTSISIPITLHKNVDNTGETGLVAASLTGSYWRQGGTRTAITLSDLAAVNSAYASGGVKEVDSTNMPGEYRLDVPDAALAVGADWVHIHVKSSNSQYSERIDLPTGGTLSDCFMDTVVELAGAYTLQQTLSILLSGVAGVTANSGTTLKTPDGNCTRIVATISGCNRTAMTLTPSGQ